MALSLTNQDGLISWTISGYGNPFNKTHYIKAGITTKSFTSGTLSAPSGIVDEVYAPISGSNTYSTGAFYCEPGTYTFYSFTQTADGAYWATGSATVTVYYPDPSAYYTVSTTNSSITFSVKGVPSTAAYWCYFRCFVYLNGVEIARSGSSGSMPYHTSDFTWTAHGLNPSTTYTVSVYTSTDAWGDETYESLSGPRTATTTRPVITVEPWSWTASNGAATATQTGNAYSILQGTRRADDFSHLVWNDLVDKIAEVRNARPEITAGWDNAYATKENTKVSAGDTLSATRFNSIRYNVNNMKGVSVPYVSAGDEIYGSYIISLTETLNQIINEL